MSYIAAALAKSKEKAAQLPPMEAFPDTPGFSLSVDPQFATLQEAPAAKPPESKLRFYVIGGAIALAAVVIAVVKLRSPKAAPIPPKSETVATTPATKSEQAQAQTKPATNPATATSVAQTTPVVPTPTPVPVEIKPSEETLALVRKFSVSAVMSGPSGRARIDGKTYHVGDEVLSGLILIEIKDSQLFFRDTAGATYTHRF